MAEYLHAEDDRGRGRDHEERKEHGQWKPGRKLDENPAAGAMSAQLLTQGFSGGHDLHDVTVWIVEIHCAPLAGSVDLSVSLGLTRLGVVGKALVDDPFHNRVELCVVDRESVVMRIDF
jgi:hypothetical protein